MQNHTKYVNQYRNREAKSKPRLTPYAPPIHGTESFPHEMPWEFLIRLAGQPSDAEFKTAESTENSSFEELLRELPPHRIASSRELGLLLGARLGLEGTTLWDHFYEAEAQGYFNEVGEVVILPEEMPESPESDATEW